MDKWLIWCDLNSEQDKLEKIFKGYCVSIKGSTPLEEKIELEKKWRLGDVPILISKPKCFAYGMNWQHCNNVIFVGLSDSYESYYQAVRRCYRFGQKEQVNVYIITSDREQNVLKNIQRKQSDFEKMQNSMVDFTKKYVRDNLEVTFKELDKGYKASVDMILPEWLKSEV